MRNKITGLALLAAACACGLAHFHPAAADDAPKPHPYRLHSVSIKQQVIWGSTCEGPDGTALSFGGEDRDAEDGLSHTRLRVKGEWIDLQPGFEKPGVQKAAHDRVWAVRNEEKDLLARARHLYFEGKRDGETPGAKSVIDRQREIENTIGLIMSDLAHDAQTDKDFGAVYQPKAGIFAGAGKITVEAMNKGIGPELLAQMRQVQVGLEEAADQLSVEPPARALSAIVYEPKSKLFVLFGGDHCDYLTNDTWVFDPAARKWTLRHPKDAPPPRANHTWKTADDGKLILTGGYTYFPNTDYMGGQYIDINDGEWTYDPAADAWTGSGKAEAPTSRTYRTGAFLPEYFYDVPRVEADAFANKLSNLPANVWTKTKPPKLPVVNRDWGTAVIDPDRDMILRWSGGHCAHGGSDVLEYHLATNRWELCYPVEFPLGQLYDNTEYPGEYNFNHRPWISGHTYQNYGVDPILKKMIFLGHSPHGYIYDPDKGDWATRIALPKGMNYSGSMYTLTTTPTPGGLICWTDPDAEVYRFDAAANAWKLLHVTGEKLPGSSVDNSTVIYDSKRDRLLFFRKEYGDKKQYDGEIYALDMKTLVASHLSPNGKEAATAIPYLCQIRYDAKHDMLLVGATLPPGADGLRRTPAYDCASNTWKSLKITGADPSGKQGRNVSLGLMYDDRRKLFWAVDTNSEVYVLKLDPASADMRDLAGP
ncbi:MAG TPA: kelch repeat-containing protein [Tepidisphaeraceae bacterium]|jgi:hypothetical protein|nr:kelch repeat-containing protein [Tepidisphaeraceae bacterium]